MSAPTVAQAEAALESAKALRKETEENVAEAQMAHQKAIAAVNRAETDLWRAKAAATTTEAPENEG